MHFAHRSVPGSVKILAILQVFLFVYEHIYDLKSANSDTENGIKKIKIIL